MNFGEMKLAKIKIRNLLNGKVITVKQTTNHPASSYNQAIWVDSKNEAYGQCNFGIPLGYEEVKERNILLIWENQPKELFSGLSPLFRKYPDIKKFKANIETSLSRKKEAYKGENFSIERLDLQR